MNIKKLILTNWGPHEQLELKFSPGLNVVYGPNEAGKTAILEAIVLTMCDDWDKVCPNIRYSQDFIGNCVVFFERAGRSIRRVLRVEKKRRRTSTKDYLKSKLLFSWAGEVESDFLVSEMLAGLLLPWKLISWNTLQGLGVDGIVEGKIKGKRRGRYKELLDLLSDLKKLNQVEQDFYRSSKLKVLFLEKELNLINQELEGLEKAKRLLAGSLYRELKMVEDEIDLFPVNILERVNQSVGRIERMEMLLNQLESEVDSISEEEIVWWHGLLEELDRLKEKTFPLPVMILMAFFAIVGVFLSVGAEVWFLRMVGVFLLFIAGLLLFLWRERAEVKKSTRVLIFEAKKRAKKDFINKEQIRDYVRFLDEKMFLIKTKKEEISKLKQELLEEKAFLAQICGQQAPQEYLANMRKKLEHLKKKRRSLQQRLNQLGVKQEDMLYEEEAVASYSESREKELMIRRENLIAEIDREKLRLHSIHSVLMSLLSLKGSEGVKEIFLAIKERQRLLKDKLKSLVSEIVASIAWRDVLDLLKTRQYEQVSSIVNQEEFLELLSLFTSGMYKEVRLIVGQNELFLYRNDQQYRFSLLSCATKHQILFALKTALMRRLYGEKAFLVLDDVFIFSDDRRLKHQLLALKSLADSGWQVIYLTSHRNSYRFLKAVGADVLCLEK